MREGCCTIACKTGFPLEGAIFWGRLVFETGILKRYAVLSLVQYPDPKVLPTKQCMSTHTFSIRLQHYNLKLTPLYMVLACGSNEAFEIGGF
jgi:hypothetical protein